MKRSFHVLTLLGVFLFLPSYGQNALNYDGTDDCVTFNYSPLSGAVARTVEAWIRTTDNHNPSAGGTQGVILDWGNISPNGSRFTFNVLWSNAIRLEVGGNGISGTTAVNDGLWHHVAAVYNPLATNTVSLYVDGVLDASGTPTVAVATGTGNLLIGKRVDNVNLFQGDIDEVRIWNIARTQSEIASNMGAEFCSMPANLIAYYKSNAGTAGSNNTGLTSLTDDSGNGHPGTLSGFSLNGNVSNWVTGAALVGGSTSSAISVNGCGSYVSPSGNYVWTTAGTYTDTLVNGIGCDSIITINLSMVTVDVALGQMGITLVSNAINAYYQWIDCNNNNSPILGATQNQFTPTVNGNYACIITQSGCVDTTMCVPITTVGVEETKSGAISVYPNPTRSGEIIVLHPIDLVDGTIELVDISGRPIGRYPASAKGSTRLDVNVPGLYFVTVSGEGVHKVVKVAVEL